MKLTAKTGYALVLLALSLASSACNPKTTMNEETASNVVFLTQSALAADRDREVMEALAFGVLEIQDDCLRLKLESGEYYTPIWPGDFRLVMHDGVPVVRYRDHTIGKVGQRIKLSGGAVESVNQIDGVIPSSCQGPFWVVGEAT